MKALTLVISRLRIYTIVPLRAQCQELPQGTHYDFEKIVEKTLDGVVCRGKIRCSERVRRCDRVGGCR